MHPPSPYYLEKITVKTMKQRGKVLDRINLLAAKRLHRVAIAKVTTQIQTSQVSRVAWIPGC